MKPRRKKSRTARERDLRDVFTRIRQTDARVAEALLTVLSRADTRTLVALSVIFEFVAKQVRRRPR